MSENFLSDLLQSLRKGWESGSSLGPTGLNIRSRPSFWNPFISWREKEQQELRALYGRVNQTFESSIYMSADELDQATIQVIVEICESAECNPSDDILHALSDPIAALIGQEFFWFPEFLEDGWVQKTSLKEGPQIKRFLEQKEQFFSDEQRYLDIAFQKLTLIFASNLEFFPDNLLMAGASEDQTEHLTFDVNVVDMIERPAAAISGTMGTMFDKDICDLRLFDDVRDQLEHNLLVASGLNPDDRHANEKSIVMPNEAKGKTPSELADTYLRHTPFAEFFLSPLPFTVSQEARFEHCHIIGGTGHGKTQLIQHLIHQDILAVQEKTRSIVVIDSQGDLIRTISHLAYFDSDNGSSLADRLVLIDPNDVEFPVALNMFDVNLDRIEHYSPLEREKILNGAIELYEYIFGALLGAELTQKQGVIFRYLARLMMVIPDATIQTLRELMEDGKPFRPYMEKLEGTARRFFETEFFHPSFNATKKQILKRLWGVLSNSTFERMFSHPRNKVDLFDAMNSGKIILINTAKDLLKQEGCEIFGRFFIAMIGQAAMERATIPANERCPTFVYIDEAHDYFDDNVEYLLNQARKYRIGLNLAHQNLDQLSAKLRASIMASTSIKLAGGVSAKDARILAQDMHCDVEFLQEMRKRRGHSEFACWVKNETPKALKITVPLGSVNALPRLSDEEFEVLIARNRERYSVTLNETKTRIEQSYSVPIPEAKVHKESKGKPTAHTPKSSIVPAEQTAINVETQASQQTDGKHKNPKTRRKLVDPYLTGQGGKEHKYLQQLVRQAAQARGYKAIIEHQVLDGAGSVDVSLEKENKRFAVEISVTTSPEHELGNVKKCFAAGYEQVFLITSNRRHLGKLKKVVEKSVAKEQLNTLHLFLPDEFIAHLDVLGSRVAGSDSMVRGYRVKVRHKPLDPQEARKRQKAIAGVIANSIQRQGSDSK